MKKKFESREVTIRELHADGYGLTDDPKFCVLGALPGESMIAMPFTKKKRKIFAKPEQILKASPDRVEPICAAASHCGGCSFQHYDPRQQILKKQAFLQLELGETQPALYFEPITGPISNYRSKARLGVRYVEKKQRVLVGFREKMKPYIAELDSCPVLKEPVSTLLTELASLIESLTIVREIPQIEVAMGDDDVALVFRVLEDASAEDIASLQAFGKQFNIDIYLQPGGLNTVHKIFPAEGEDRLHYQLPMFDLRFSFHPMDFTQVNQAINRLMVDRAITLLDIQETDRVFDGFCGIGNFSLALARRCAQVFAFEASATCVERGRENAAANAIENCTFSEADLFQEDLELAVLKDVNKVLLDPPRSGALEVCKRLASHKVERVVYVSCNPVTLARDAKILVDAGYKFDGGGVIDMFPHTTHVESIACFSSCK